MLERSAHLRATSAAVRFYSCEPLLGDLGNVPLEGIGWVICGGESGPHARPMHPDWARSLRDQCAEAGVPFHFKQWGEWAPDEGPLKDGDPIMEGRARCAWWNGGRCHYETSGYAPAPSAGIGEWVYRLGKKRAGRHLDGRTHDQYPEVR
jgi:protein gp37